MNIKRNEIIEVLAVRYNNEIWEVRGVFGNGELHLYRSGV